MTTETETEPHRRHLGALARLTRACAHHPWRTVFAWIAIAVVIVGASNTIGGKLVNDFTIPNSDAQRASDLLKDRFPAQSGDNAQLIFQAPDGLTTPQSRRPSSRRSPPPARSPASPPSTIPSRPRAVRSRGTAPSATATSSSATRRSTSPPRT